MFPDTLKGITINAIYIFSSFSNFSFKFFTVPTKNNLSAISFTLINFVKYYIILFVLTANVFKM